MALGARAGALRLRLPLASAYQRQLDRAVVLPDRDLTAQQSQRDVITPSITAYASQRESDRALPFIRCRSTERQSDVWTRPGSFANGYQYRRRIIPASYAVGPVMLFDETLADLKSTGNGGLVNSTSGWDIRFESGGDNATAAGGVKLGHIVDSYSPTTGRLVWWLRTGTVPASPIFIYYGKTGLSAAEANPALASADFTVWWNGLTGTDYTGQAGRSVTPTGVTGTTLGSLVAGLYNGTTALMQAAPWAGAFGLTVVAMDAYFQASFIGQNRGLFIQGPKPGAASFDALALYWRDQTAAGLANPVLSNFTGNGAPGGFFVSGTTLANDLVSAPVQDQLPMMVHTAATSGQLPVMFIRGASVAGTNNQAFVGTVDALGGANMQVGDGPDTPASTPPHPRTGPWLGKIAFVRIRSALPTAAQAAAEWLNINDPKSTYGIGDRETPGEADRSPVAVPTMPFAVTENIPTLLPVLATTVDPDGDTASLAAGSLTVPTHGTAAISGTKALYTPAAGYLGDDAFLFGARDPTGKTSIGKCRVSVGAPTVTMEPGTFGAMRTIWGDAGHNNGITDAQLTQVLNGDFSTVFLRVDQAGAGTATALQPGDHVMLVQGTFPTARQITANGTQANPIVFRADPNSRGLVRCQQLWTFRNRDKIAWGLRWENGFGKVDLGGLRNGIVRCVFTGWYGKNQATNAGFENALTPTKLPDTLGVTPDADCFCWYSSFHDPAPWGSTGDPPGAPTDYIDVNRFGIRWGSAKPDKLAIGFHVKRCDFYGVPAWEDKPKPDLYKSGQTDAIEVGGDVQTTATGTLFATRDANGNVTAITNYLDSRFLMEDCVIRDHLEGQRTGAASLDCKVSGATFRRIAMRGNTYGRLDFRGGCFNTMEDISFEDHAQGSWISGYGFVCRRVGGGKVTIAAGNVDAASIAQSVPWSDGSQPPQGSMYQQSQGGLVEDRTGTLVVGQDPTAAKANGATDPLRPARQITVRRISTPPANNTYDDTAVRALCTYETGTPSPPLNIPANNEVGVNAPWVG